MDLGTRLYRARKKILRNMFLYEIHIWFPLILLTFYNAFLLETFTPPFGAIISVVVSLAFMVLPTLIFYMLYLVTSSKMDHIQSINILRRYDLVVKIITVIDVLILAEIVACMIYTGYK
jgi:hypothetical protein